MDYADLATAALLGLFCGAADAFALLRVGRLFVPLTLLSSVLLGVLVALSPPATELAATALFITLFLAGFWLLDRFLPGDGWGRGGSDGEPPWWPDFEAQFRRYSRRSRPKAGVR